MTSRGTGKTCSACSVPIVRKSKYRLFAVQSRKPVPSCPKLNRISFFWIFRCRLGDDTGFSLLESLPDIPFEVIFVTAYDSYAIQAIRFSALDYLLKPIDPEELTHAVDKAVQVVLRKQENKRMQNLLQNKRALDKQKKIALSVADKIEFVEIGSIVRCESESNYTTFYLKSGEKLIVSKTLKEFDDLLTPYNFLRVHQSHLINLEEIKSFIKSDGGYIRMKDGSSISISRQRRNYVMEVLKQL